MRRWQKVLLSITSATFVIFFAAAVIVPEIIREKAIEQVRKDYNRELKIERFIINLFNLQVDIRKLELKDVDSDRTFVSFDRLNFSLSLRSLYDRALIIDDLTLEQPFVLLEKTGDDSFNFSDFIPPPATRNDKPEEPSASFLFSFNNLQIKNGTFVIFDSSSDIDLVHHIDDLNLAVPFVGNIPYLVERYIQPSISLRIDGTPLVASGQMKPFDKSVETQLNLNLNGIELPFYAAYLQPVLPFELTDGTLSTQLEISYRVSSTQEPKLLIGGDLTLSTLRLEQQGQPLFFLPLLLIQLDWANPFSDEYHFSNVSIYEPQLQVRREQDGSLNLLQLIQQPQTDQPAKTESARPLPNLTIEILRVRRGIINLRDAVPPGGFASRIYDINLLTRNLGTHDQTPAPFEFSLKTSHRERVQLDGELNLIPFAFNGQFSLQGLPLGAYSPYLKPFLTHTPTGSVNLQTDLSLTQKQQKLSKLRFSLTNFHQDFSDQDSFQLDELLVAEVQVLLPQNEVEIAEIMLKRGELKLSTDKKGELPFARLLKEQSPEKQATVEEPQATPGPGWKLKLAQLSVDDFNNRFTDWTAPNPTPVAINHFNLKLTDLHWPQAIGSAWQFDGTWEHGGLINGAGQLRHTPLTLKGKFALEQFDLTPLNGYIPTQILLTLGSAKLDTDLKFNLEQEKTLHGKVTGSLGLRNFSVTGLGNENELLSWESLQLDDLQVDLEPLSLSIAQVSLNNYLAKIRVRDDGQINLNRIMAEEEEEQVQATAAQVEEAFTLPPIRIDELTLQGGEVSFVDMHLPKIFSSTMYELGGRISGLTSEAGKYASVDLRGALDNHSPLTINGKIAPLAGDLDTELKIRFNDIDLAPVTPYSGTYLGYSIDKGKLYLDLDYKISNQQVTATNKIFIDQFTFGEAVESEEATGLPVRLAVALLKDRQGEIHLELPVSGNIDDPEFGILSTVMTLLKNLLIKAATAPFSLLASMFGGGGEDFSQLGFPPGIASLTPADQDKLGKLNQMLIERPSLKLEISAFVDLEVDPEGYRKEQLKQAVTKEWQKRAKSQTGQIMVPDEYLENLRRVYSRAKFPKPRNTLGLAKKLPPAEMEKLLLANMLVEDEQLIELAKSRAAVVKNDLIRQNPELRPRIFLKNADIKTPPEEGKNPARVEFGIAAS